jgi:hypothetical protein
MQVEHVDKLIKIDEIRNHYGLLYFYALCLFRQYFLLPLPTDFSSIVACIMAPKMNQKLLIVLLENICW